MDAFFTAIVHFTTLESFLLLLAGCILALCLGILPGLSSTEAMIILLPFTFTLDLNSSMILLSAAYASAFVGGALTSIVFGIPGTSTGLATPLDGHPLHLKNKTVYAVSVAASSSACAGLLSLLIVVILLPVIEPLSLLFGPAEWFAFVVLGLVILAFSSEGSFEKGLISAGLGLLLSAVGLGVVTGMPRFTLGLTDLWGGIPIVAAFVGLYPLTEAFDMALRGHKDTKIDVQNSRKINSSPAQEGQILEGITDTMIYTPKWILGAIIGWLVGVIPGVGGTLANMLGYLVIRETSKNKRKFGKGDVRGLIGSESANNASVGGALVPALALGIPGSLNTAILLGVFMINGVQPGTNVFSENLDVTFIILIGVAAATLLSSAIVMCGGWRLVDLISRMSTRLIAPGIMFIGFVAVLLARGNPFDLVIAGVLTLVGLAMKRNGFSRISFVIALMLGSLVESAFFQSLAIGRGSYGIFLESTTSIIIWFVVFLCLVLHFSKMRDLFQDRKGL